MNERHGHERRHRATDAGTAPRLRDMRCTHSGASWPVTQCESQPWMCHMNWKLHWQYHRMAFFSFRQWPLEVLQPCDAKKHFFLLTAIEKETNAT